MKDGDLFAVLEKEERPRDFMVPQAVFLSWSPAAQFRYCAARDRDSLLDPDLSDDVFRFLHERAEMYERAATE